MEDEKARTDHLQRARRTRLLTARGPGQTRAPLVQEPDTREHRGDDDLVIVYHMRSTPADASTTRTRSSTRSVTKRSRKPPALMRCKVVEKRDGDDGLKLSKMKVDELRDELARRGASLFVLFPPCSSSGSSCSRMTPSSRQRGRSRVTRRHGAEPPHPVRQQPEQGDRPEARRHARCLRVPAACTRAEIAERAAGFARKTVVLPRARRAASPTRRRCSRDTATTRSSQRTTAT